MNKYTSIYTPFLILIFFIGILKVKAQDDIPNKKMEKLFSEIDYNTIFYPKTAINQFDSLKGTFNEINFAEYRGYIDFLDAQFYYNDMKVDSALHYAEDAISWFTKRENVNWLSKCQYLLGKIAETTSLFEQAKINYYETINLSQDENIWVGSAYIGIARCKKALEESYSEEMGQGIRILREVGRYEVGLFADFMEQYFNLSSPDSPANLKRIAEKYLNHKFYDRAVSVYKFVASSFYIKEKFDSAHVYCNLAIDLSEEYGVGKLVLPALFQFKGVLYFKQQEYNTADTYFNESLALYQDNNQSNRMHYAYNYIHQIDKARGDYSKAYADLQKYINLIEKTTTREKMRMAKVLEVNNKMDRMRSQLSQLKVEKKASEFMLYLVMVVTTMILAGVGIYIYQYQKSKKAKIDELNKEFHNLLIGIGEKQLLEHRLNASNLKESKKKEEEENLIPSHKIEDSSIGDSFDSCYMETINLFTGSFPQLTKTEVRYAVMICLKLPIEVIAKVQNVQPASIRKAKQRIRTKLNINDSLEVYLQEFRERQISKLAV